MRSIVGIGAQYASVLQTTTIAAQELIDDSSLSFTNSIVANDLVMDLYLHTSGGAVWVSGGSFGAQIIHSVSIAQSDQNYFEDIVGELDSIIDLDFRFVGSADAADASLYFDTEIALGGSGDALGLAVSTDSDWELYINYTALSNDIDYRHYAMIHEWGHSLGMEHPFEDGDGDVVGGITDPWNSAYPEDTVMAYRSPQEGYWPDFFSINDLNALIAAWGAERQLLTMEVDHFIGQVYGELVYSARGDDVISSGEGEDIVRAGKGNDWVNGNAGNDTLFGDLGDDILRGGKNDDWIDGGAGNDQIWGNKGADRIRISEGDDILMDFSFAAGDRIEVELGINVGLEQLGSDLLLSTELGSLTLKNVNIYSFDLAQAIVNV